MLINKIGDKLLTKRKNTLLGLVIEKYITTATPVSSNSLSESKELSVSPATIRSELANLENEGYITHKHTSSGRVPCDMGYRYYVRDIMNEKPPTFNDRLTIEHQMHQVQGNIDRRLAITASMLSSLINNAVVITKKQKMAELNDIKIFDVLPERFLILVIFSDGTVKKGSIDKKRSVLSKKIISLESLNTIVRQYFLNKKISTSDDIEEDYLIKAIEIIITGEEYAGNEETFIEGVSGLIAQPEFSTKESMLSAYDALASLKYQPISVHKPDIKKMISVSIGDEIPIVHFRNLSIISASYKLRGETTGSIMAIGPKRMQYGKVIPLVRYVADLLSY